jgi:ATP-dependent protease HslVU (ClpYQ) peptidase subunit
MTVCVGAICDSGKCAVVAADKMVTFGPPMMLQTEPSTIRKITSLTPESVLLFSGSMPEGEELISRSISKLTGGTKPPISKVAEAVKSAYIEHKRSRVEETILRPLLGLDFAQFQALVGQSPSSAILGQIMGLIVQHNLQLDALIAGADDKGSHIYLVTHPGVIIAMDTMGFAAIGSGGLHASVRIALTKHNKTASLVETVHSVFEAKKAAEVAPGVGNLTDMAVIKGGKICMVDDKLFKTLEGMYKEKPSLSQEEREKLQGACNECIKEPTA